MTMTKKDVAVPAGEFKAKCLALLDKVAETGQPLVVTKRGKPVARVVAVEEPPSLLGSVTYPGDPDEIIRPLDEPWNVELE
jgi:prevent-host-death family protein